MRTSIFGVSLLWLLVACNGYSPNLPSAPFLCGSGTPACPEGYNCMADGSSTRMVCVLPNLQVPDAPNTCANDSNLEPNDSIATAYQTPIDGVMRTTIPYTGLAICPAGDKDTYAVNLGAQTSLEAVVTYEEGGAPLQVTILSMQGSPLANGSPTGTQDQIRAYVNTLPVGSYYVQVYGPASGSMLTNNYSLKINSGT